MANRNFRKFEKSVSTIGKGLSALEKSFQKRLKVLEKGKDKSVSILAKSLNALERSFQERFQLLEKGMEKSFQSLSTSLITLDEALETFENTPVPIPVVRKGKKVKVEKIKKVKAAKGKVATKSPGRRGYDAEKKARIVEFIQSKGRAGVTLAHEKFNVAIPTLYNWMKGTVKTKLVSIVSDSVDSIPKKRGRKKKAETSQEPSLETMQSYRNPALPDIEVVAPNMSDTYCPPPVP